MKGKNLSTWRKVIYFVPDISTWQQALLMTESGETAEGLHFSFPAYPKKHRIR